MFVCVCMPPPPTQICMHMFVHAYVFHTPVCMYVQSAQCVYGIALSVSSSSCSNSLTTADLSMIFRWLLRHREFPGWRGKPATGIGHPCQKCQGGEKHLHGALHAG